MPEDITGEVSMRLSKCCEVTTSLDSFLGVDIMLGLGKLVGGIFGVSEDNPILGMTAETSDIPADELPIPESVEPKTPMASEKMYYHK